MRNSRPLLSRPATLRAATIGTATPPQPLPTIRLIEPTPGTSPAPSIPPWVQISPPTLPPAPPLDPDPEVPRTRLLPKKSKLALLGVGSRDKDKEKEKKQQQHTRNASSGRGGFEIFVDPTYDPDIGEIIMVKKKKSRAALDGVQWGLTEVTNVPPSAAQQPSLPGPKTEQKEKERDKWWSIGKGRKDLKDKTKEKEREKEKDKARSKSPTESRMRFDSLDSGILLNSAPAPPPITISQPDEPTPVSYSRSGTPTIGGLLAVPGGPPPTNSSGSIALRAIRSVRSLARIGSWAQLRNTDDAGTSKKENTGDDKKKKASVKDGSKEKKSKKQKDGEKKGQKTRISTSSFEAGALSAASPIGKVKTVGKKQSILGLPASIRLPSLRSGSTASSNRLSVESIPANGKQYAESRARSGSTLSSGSSLRPSSSVSGTSHASSGCSVRWDEDCLETVKERRKADKEARERHSGDGPRSTKNETTESLENAGKENRHSSEGRRRTLISEVFPQSGEFPIVTVEEATSDGHEAPEDEPITARTEVDCQTPARRARVRPLSEQLLCRARPVGIYEDGNGVLSILDAATNDLAQLINRLDLQATPGTPDASPVRHGNDHLNSSPNYPESPLKGGHRESVNSLRSYAQIGSQQTQQLNTAKGLIGQQIAPWSTLNRSISPADDASSKSNKYTSKNSANPLGQPHKVHLTHKRTLTPSPAAEPSPVLKPLCPARARQPSGATSASSSSPTPSLRRVGRTIRVPSSLTFGSPLSSGSRASLDSEVSPLPSPVFKKRESYVHARKRSSLVPNELKGNQNRPASVSSLPIPPEAKRVLGLAGTMGSIADGYGESAPDAEDPDSDIPNELQVILAGQSDEEGERYLEDTLQQCERTKVLAPPSPGCPPSEPLPTPVPASIPALPALPTFRAQLINENDVVEEVDDGGHSSEEDDTKKSFDFTGELKKLNESGASDRRSFVEQLENAFRTPAKIDLRYAFQDAFLKVDVPPVPKMPEAAQTSVTEDDSVKEETKKHFDSSDFPADSLSISKIVDIKEPTLLLGTDSLCTDEDVQIDSFLNHDSSPRILRNMSSMGSKASDGQLNTEFKFGGRAQDKPPKKPLTLSDIIPPPAHQRMISNLSMVEEDSEVLKSIFAKAVDIPSAARRMRLDSDSSSKRRFRVPIASTHKRHSSELSFAGFKSFDEVRRGFEFANRQAFYPPVNVSSRNAHRQRESVFSIASVSSYGFVTNPGSTDPFDYGMSVLRERPSSEISSFSMSMSVDDTFAFVNRVPQLRRRVNSDASSFYFRAPTQPPPYNRSHRRHDSTMSIASQGPPISLYNRSFGGHLRNDSSASSSSVAHSYAMYGANGGRAAWARHRQDASIDSIMSDFSVARLGRPGLGEKMFDKCEQSMPLSAISASPPESISNERIGNRSSFDSIMDNDRRSSMDDSLFDQTGQRSSVSSDSVFGDDEEHLFARNQQLLLPNQFRPLSMVSIASIHSPMKEDDTMISVLAGRGHVRRRSVGAAYEASPCIRFEKKRRHQEEVNIPIFDVDHDKDPSKDSPNKARIISMPSIMSTSSSKFGGERMIKAQRGLLARESLEDSALIGSGEDSSLIGLPTMFSKPCPASRSRSSTCTSLSSGAETPPLSSSDGSQSESPQSSVDLSHLNMILANITHPVAATTHARVRARARGTGHRRPISQHARASVYETIEEEKSNPPTPQRPVVAKKSNSELATDEVYIVDPDSASINSTWDDECGIVALRKYYALRDEAEVAVTESKLKWQDTPFSLFALQSFYPPNHAAGMRALLQHSLETYHPLPSDLRLRRARSRTLSRPSPYPQTRVNKSTLSPEHTRLSFGEMNRSAIFNPSALQEVLVNLNIVSPPPIARAVKGQTPAAEKVIEPKRENAFGLAPHVRPRVGSNARRTALGWSKRSNGKTSTEKKENVGQGVLMTPGESLRINRPRPRGRPTPVRPIRV